MKKIYFYVLIILCFTFKLVSGKIDIVKNNKWLNTNEKFIKLGKSFLSRFETSQLIIFPLNKVKNSELIGWDCEGRFFNYIVSKKNVKFLKGKQADPILLGTKIIFDPIKIHIISDNNQSEGNITAWFKAKISECPNNIIFPYFIILTDKNKFLNSKQIIGIICLDDKILKRFIEPMHLRSSFHNTVNGKRITGIGGDFNNDRVDDVFIYKEKSGESKEYTYVYINIEGELVCFWVQLIEECF